MKYPGAELDSFDKASIWRKYIFWIIKKYIKGFTLEVGAGIGSFTNNYKSLANNITLSEIDTDNLSFIKEKFKTDNFNFTSDYTKNINKNFDTIMYLNVLEHIEKDIEEIEDAFKKLNPKGYLIILVPAHNKLYSKFDKAVGHFKRYDIGFFKNIKIQKSKLIKLSYLDYEYFFIFLNKIFLKKRFIHQKLKF